MKNSLLILFSIILFTTCQTQPKDTKKIEKSDSPQIHPQPPQQTPTIKAKQYVVVLGIAQDAGYPQAGCTKQCCAHLWNSVDYAKDKKMVVSLGIVDQVADKKWIVDATPDFKEQLAMLNNYLPSASMLPEGILLTHGHIGHYTGLMHLGREVIGAKNLSVFAMPRMQQFLTQNGPWSQLVKLNNIKLTNIYSDSTFQLSPQIKVTPLQVPHRGEFTETVGYKISGKSKTVLFIPDIDKWRKWKTNLKALINEIDVALLDGTFYKNGEIPNRDMSLIPHPFIEESFAFFQDLPATDKAKIHFIHFNHTNPLIQVNSLERKEVVQKGYKMATEGQIIQLD